MMKKEEQLQQEILRCKRTEEALRQERDRAQKYLDIAGVMFVANNAKGEVTLINRKGSEILGYEQKEIIGKNWFDSFLPVRIREDVKTVFNGLMAGDIEPSEYHENPVLTKGGEERIIAWHNTVVKDDKGNIIGTLSSGEDITDRKQAAEARKENELRFKLVTETIKDVFWMSTCGVGKMVYISPAYETLWERSRESLYQSPRSFLETIHSDDIDGYLGMLSKFHKNGKSYECEFRIIRRDGEVRWIHERGYPVRHSLDRAQLMAGVCTDITARKKEDKRRDALRSLASLFSSEGSLDKVYQEVAELLRSHLDYPATAVELYDQDAGEMVYVGSSGIPTSDVDTLRVPLDQTISGMVAVTGQAIMELDATRRIEYQHGTLRKLNTTTFLCAPVVVGARVLGTVSLADSVKRDDAKTTLETLQIIASHLAQELDRRWAYEELSERENKYRLLTENTRDVIFRIRISDATYEYVSPSAFKAFGYSPDDFYGDPQLLMKILPQGWNAYFQGKWAEIYDGKLPQTYEFPIIHKITGETKWMYQSNVWIADEKDELIALQGRVTDITERKRAEVALQESEHRFRALTSSSPVGIFQADAKGKGVYVNQQVCSFTGLPEKKHDGDGWASTIHPDDKDRVYRFWKTTIEGTASFETEFRFVRKDKRLTWVASRAAVFNDEDGNVTGFIGTLTDITERKKAEEEHEKLQEQLFRAQKMESVGRLAGGVAHDFNNNLGVILGHAEMILMEMKPGDPQYANLEEIRKAAKHSADLTRQLLAFARKQMISPKVLDLNETVAGMLKMLGRLIGEDIDLAWKPETNLWPVRMDPAQVDQILANLCVNARDAFSGMGKITIKTENVILDQAYCARHAGFVPGEYVMLAVNDDGSGMDKETLEKVFEPFFTTKEVGKGTGLGLSTVYGIVRQNKGFINVYSEPGKGTTFKIYIPRNKAGPMETAEIRRVKAPRGQGEKVLLVEDDPAILALGQMMLENLGYAVLAANSPNEAMELAQKHPGRIHLLVTDVVMPRMSGRDLARRIKEGRPEIKILFMSGYTADVIAHHGVLDEGVHFMEKPFSMSAIASHVRTALEE